MGDPLLPDRMELASPNIHCTWKQGRRERRKEAGAPRFFFATTREERERGFKSWSVCMMQSLRDSGFDNE